MVIDLGHHQAFAAPAPIHASAPLLRLGAGTDGLVVRWCEPNQPAERLHDRLERLVATGNIRGAAETATAIAECLADLVPVPDDDRSARIAVPLSASPGHRAHVRTAFRSAGFAVDDADLIGRPYATLGLWLAVDGHRRHGLPRGKTLVIDNDGGRVSALVVDIARCVVLAERQITTTSVADPFQATLVLRQLLEASYGSVDHDTPVPWSVLSASIAEIVVSGSGAVHPAFTKFINERFPASTLHPPPGPGAEIVVRGLQHIDRLGSYRCAWPTLDLRFDHKVIRTAGGWTPTDAAPTVAPVGTHVSFGEAAVVLRNSTGQGQDPTRASDDIVLADAGLRIPERVGPFPLMSVHPSGSIEIRGTEASLRLHFDWPIANSLARVLTVVVEHILDLTIDRAPFTPRGDPPHRATDES